MKISRLVVGLLAVSLLGCGGATSQIAHAGPAAWTGSTPPKVAPAPRVPEGLKSQVRPLPEDVAALTRARNPQISPDGKRVAYTVSTSTRDAEAKPSDSDTTGGWTRETQLFVVPATGGEPRQLTFGERGGSRALWAPDGRHLAFIRKGDGGAPQIHVLSLDGGEARPVDTGKLAPHGFRWTHDGQGFYFLATPARDDAAKEAAWARGGASEYEQDFDKEAVFEVRRDAPTPKQVTDGSRHVIAYDFSSTGRHLAVVTSDSADPYLQSLQAKVQVIELRSGEVVAEPSKKLGMVAQLRWSPDGQKLAWSHSPDGLSLLHGLSVYDIGHGTQIDVAKPHDVTIGGFTWAADSKHITAALQDRTNNRLVRFSLDAKIKRDKTPLPYVLWQFESVSQGGLAAVVASNPSQPPEIAVLDLKASKIRLLTDANPQVKRDWTLATAEVVQWKNTAGQAVEGILYKTNASKTSPPPLMVLPHGGPDSVSQTYFDVWAHFFAARGYSVLRPNYRGGTGYGFAWYAANRGKLGDTEFADIEPGVDAMVERGLADKDRLYYGGWSWGGYLSAWTLAHTNDRYRAIVVGAGVNDTAIQYVTSDINHGAAADWEYKGRPYTDKALWDAQNPARHLAGAKTPTLIIHGRGDTRVDFVNGQVLFRALKDVGCPVSFWAYPRENHGFREPAHVAHMLTEWARWFDTH